MKNSSYTPSEHLHVNNHGLALCMNLRNQPTQLLQQRSFTCNRSHANLFCKPFFYQTSPLYVLPPLGLRITGDYGMPYRPTVLPIKS